MNKLTKLLRPTWWVAAGVCLAWAAWAQTDGVNAAEPSAADVQTYIEVNHGKLIAAGDSEEDAYKAAVDSALEFFWKKPELVAAALLSLGYEPTQIAVMFVNLGVSAPSTATAVITAAGATAAEPVKEVLLLNTTPEEAVAIEAAVTDVVVKLATPAPTEAPTPEAEEATPEETTAEEAAPAEPVTEEPVTEVEPVPPAEPEPAPTVPESEPVVPVPQPQPVEPVLPPTPPSTGGLGTTRA